MAKFYVYIDSTDDNQPFYVGKGMIKRIKSLRRNNKHQHISKQYGCNRKIIFETSNESKAYNKEIKLITELHTYIKDPVAHKYASNFTRGGEGCKPYKGRIAWNKGKKCPQLCGENNGFYKKKHTEESLKIMRAKRAKQILTPEAKERQRQGIKKSWTDPIRRQETSKAIRKAWSDPELRRQQSKRLMGKTRKLSPEQEKEIYKRSINYKRGDIIRMAKEFNVHRKTIRMIIKRNKTD